MVNTDCLLFLWEGRVTHRQPDIQTDKDTLIQSPALCSGIC